MRQAVAIAVVLALAAGVWLLWPRGDVVPAAREGPDAADAAGAALPAAASLKVTTDPRMKVFTREETLAGTAPGNEVRGVVDGPEGAPVGGLRVTARSRVPFRPAATTVTAKDGAFRLQGVDDDLLDVLLGDVPEGWTAPSAIATAGGPALRLRLEKRKPKEASNALPVAVTVLDYDGKPVVRARVKVQGRRDEKNFLTADSEVTDADGVARIDVTDPGAHLWLAVERPEGRDDVFETEIDGWKPRDETIRLKRAVRVSGTVATGGGSPWPFGQVYWRQGQGAWRTVQNVGRDGDFVLERVEQAPVQFVAFMFPTDPPFPVDTPVTEADPSAGPVSVVASQPHLLAVRLGPLEGNVVDQVTIARMSSEDSWGENDWRWDPQDGEVLYYRAASRAARYRVYARRHDGKVAYATNLEVGSADRPVVVPWAEGKDIRVFVKWTGEEKIPSAPYIAQGMAIMGVPTEGGIPIPLAEARARKKPPTEYVLRGVPPGSWKVEVSSVVWASSEWFEGSAVVGAGETATIAVRKLSQAEVDERMDRIREGFRNR